MDVQAFETRWEEKINDSACIQGRGGPNLGILAPGVGISG